MSYREVDVLEIKEVLRRWLAGAKKKQIARELGLDPKTVRRYVSWAEEERADLSEAQGAEPPDPPESEPGPEARVASPTEGEALLEHLVASIANRRHASRGRPHGDAWARCMEHKEELVELLKTRHLNRPLTLKKAGKLLYRRRGVDIPYSTLHRFAMSELGYGRPTLTVPVADGEPGKELQIDTGWVAEIEGEGGKKKRVKAWLFTPVLSRYSFVYPIERETTAESIQACEAAWDFYGGVFEVLIPDNTKAIVEHADPLDPKIVHAFLEYSQARGFYIDTARVRTPTDKPRVERNVRHVRQDCFAGERLRNVEETRALALHWCRDEYGQRIHSTTRRLPREHFEEVEKPALLALPAEPYDLPNWTKPRVQRDQHAQVALALYSLPAHFVGRKVDARADSRTVRFYVRGELIKVHSRVAPGGRSTDKSDFHEERFATAQRDTAFYLARAQEQGEWVGKYADALLDSKLPWTRMRQVHALLRLPKRYGLERVEDACRAALEIDLLNVARLERVIQLGRPAEAAPKRAGKVIPFPKFLRPTSDYALPRRANEDNTPTTNKEGRA